MCFVFIWEQTATCTTYSINWLVFITEMKSVYCAVRTGHLNKAVCASSLMYKCLVNCMPVKRNNFCCHYIWFFPSPNLIIMILAFRWNTTKNIISLLSGLYISGMQNESQANKIYITITFFDLSPDKFWKLPGGVAWF